MASDPEILLLTREVVKNAAPRELLLVDDYDPAGTSFGKTARGPSGFGVETVAVIILPFVYKFFESFIAEAGKNSATEIIKKAAKTLDSVRTSAQSRREAILGKLKELGLPEASLITTADAILAVIERPDSIAK